MDEKTIQAQLQEVEEARRRNDEERVVLDSLIAGYRGWLKLRAVGGATPETPPPASIAARIKPTPSTAKATKNRSQKSQRSASKGTISMRAAVRQILEEANGTALHVTTILERALELGARTEGKEPKGVVDLMAYSLAKSQPLEKVGPRTWRWISVPARPGD